VKFSQAAINSNSSSREAEAALAALHLSRAWHATFINDHVRWSFLTHIRVMLNDRRAACDYDPAREPLPRAENIP
jgi:hypothetical protein